MAIVQAAARRWPIADPAQKVSQVVAIRLGAARSRPFSLR
jgi:hypothetical protein